MTATGVKNGTIFITALKEFEKGRTKGRQEMRDEIVAYLQEKWIHQCPACVTADLKDRFGDSK